MPATQTTRRRNRGGFAPLRSPTIVLPRTRTKDVLRREAEVRSRQARWRDRTRRLLNIVAACVLLIPTLPLMLIIAALIKLTSPGPVLFTQNRVGINRRTGPADPRRVLMDGPQSSRRRTDYGGRIFKIFKFRTMRTDSEKDGQVWATPDDPRITPIGSVLRKYRLDELPQLLNILRGDMNLVGPRPEQPEIFRALSGRIDGYPVRQQVLPGITGWAQVNQSYDQSLDDVKRKTDLDLQYIERRSALEDLRIMARTVPVVVLRKGSL